jgi:formylglycine-generating enzyme
MSCAIVAVGYGCADDNTSNGATNEGSGGSGATSTAGEAGDDRPGTGGSTQGGSGGNTGATAGAAGDRSDGGADAGGTSTGGAGTGGSGKGGAGAGGAGSSGAGSGGTSGSAGSGGGGGCDGCSSCAGMTGTECQGESCCESLLVTGGTFMQGEPDAFESTVSSFRLDKYEVTVARFRRFHVAYDAWRAAGNPTTDAGAGRDPNTGWAANWATNLPATASALGTSLSCNSTYQTWHPSSGNENLPISCVSWYVAFAFCIWDGGRLPTEAEWEYASAGGSDDLLYPWGNSPVPSGAQDASAAYAVYGCLADGSEPSSCTVGDVLPVGSKPLGRGSYGHLDLAGSMTEWVFDWNADYPTTPRTDYVRIDPAAGRVFRGGNWQFDASFLTAATRQVAASGVSTGIRCARSAP